MLILVNVALAFWKSCGSYTLDTTTHPEVRLVQSGGFATAQSPVFTYYARACPHDARLVFCARLWISYALTFRL